MCGRWVKRPGTKGRAGGFGGRARKWHARTSAHVTLARTRVTRSHLTASVRRITQRAKDNKATHRFSWALGFCAASRRPGEGRAVKGVRYRAGGERGYCFPVSLLRTEHGPKHFHQGEMPLARRHVQGVNASGAVWGRVFMDMSRILPGSPTRPRSLRNYLVSTGTNCQIYF